MNPVWWTQIKTVIRLELKKTFFAKRGLWIYVVAALPVALFLVYAVARSNQQPRSAGIALPSDRALSHQDMLSIRLGMSKEEVIAILGKPPLDSRSSENHPAGPGAPEQILRENFHYSDGLSDLYLGLKNGKVENIHLYEENLGQDAIMFAGVFQFFFLRLAVFFGCLGIFMNLFRGEVLDRSLHFYFLSPIRREVLMVGKFLAGLLATCTIFVTSVILQTLAFLWHFNPHTRDLYLYHHHGL